MSQIFKKVIVIGVNPLTDVIDWEKKVPEGTPMDERPTKKAVPITFLLDVDKVTKEGGYLGDVKVFSYDCPPDKKEFLSQFKVNEPLLLMFEQTIYGEKSKKAGKVFEELLGVYPVPVL